MGEIDTDPIKSVRASVSHFGEKCSQIKSRASSDDEQDKEKDLEALLRDLATCKVQLEAMDSAHKHALLKQDHYEKTIDGLSMLLKSSELEKDVYSNECREARTRVAELESKIEEMANDLTELKSTRSKLLTLEAQLVAATDAKVEAMKQADMLNETILHLRISSMEAENAKAEVEKELICVGEQLLSKTVVIDSLQTELERANQLHGLSEEVAADAVSDMIRIKKENLDQAKYIELLETELTQLKMELREANEQLQMITGEMGTMRSELEEISDRENEAQVEIALLKAELHKGRSKTAAAEAAELRAKGEKSAAYFALQQMAIEAQEAKNERQRSQSEHEGIGFQDSKSDTEITISLAKDDPETESKDQQETENLKKELESAMARVSEFRARAEQAATRAEVAEQAKTALEEQIKQWKEQKQRRRAALMALREESMTKSSYSFQYDDNPKTYMPLDALTLKQHLKSGKRTLEFNCYQRAR